MKSKRKKLRKFGSGRGLKESLGQLEGGFVTLNPKEKIEKKGGAVPGALAYNPLKKEKKKKK